jgi:putative DNA primase/helicase
MAFSSHGVPRPMEWKASRPSVATVSFPLMKWGRRTRGTLAKRSMDWRTSAGKCGRRATDRCARLSHGAFFGSTGEVTLAAKMAEAGLTPMAGQEVRLLNIPADAGRGVGIYQELHGFNGGAELSDYLTHATRTYYGTAARVFLERLAAERERDPKELIETIAEMRQKFLVGLALPDGADGQVISAAQRFALIAAAGELARVLAVLPWPDGEARDAAAACFRAWLADRGGTEPAEDQRALAAVRRFLGLHGESRFVRLVPLGGDKEQEAGADGPRGAPTTAEDVPIGETRTPWETINRAGWRRDGPDGGVFLILPDIWKAEVCKGLNPTATAAAVHKAGYLIRGEGKNWAKNRHIPDLGTARLYHVLGSILQGQT